MNSIQFFNSTSSSNDKKASKPVVVQESLTIANGTGGTLQTLVEVAEGDCAPYGGQIVNKGCYELQVTAKYLDGGDCDACTIDNLYLTCVTFYVPANSVFPIPDGYYAKLQVGTVDSTRTLVSNTTSVDVSLYSSHSPSCGGCVVAPSSSSAFDSGKVSVQNGGGYEQVMSGFPTTGLNVWIWSLDNSFNLEINGQSIASVSELNFAENELQTYLDAGLTAADVVFASDNAYLYDGAPWDYPSDAVDPLVKVNISGTGAVTLRGWRNDAYEDLKLLNGATLRTVAPLTDDCSQNVLTYGQSNEAPPTQSTIRVFSA